MHSHIKYCLFHFQLSIKFGMYVYPGKVGKEMKNIYLFHLFALQGTVSGDGQATVGPSFLRCTALILCPFTVHARRRQLDAMYNMCCGHESRVLLHEGKASRIS